MLFWPSKFGKKTAHIRLLGLGAVVDHSGGRPRLPACLPVVEVLPDLCEPEDRAVGHPGGPELQVVCAPVCSPPFLVPLSASAQPPFAHRARSTQFLLSLSLEPTLALSEVLGPVTTLSHRSVSRFLFSHSDRLSPYTQRTVTIVHGRASRKYCCHWATAEGILRFRPTARPNKRLSARTLASPRGP